MSHIGRAVKIVAQAKIARECGIGATGVFDWVKKGRLPLTDIEESVYRKKTNYAEVIERLTNGEVTKEQLHQDIYDHYNKRAA